MKTFLFTLMMSVSAFANTSADEIRMILSEPAVMNAIGNEYITNVSKNSNRFGYTVSFGQCALHAELAIVCAPCAPGVEQCPCAKLVKFDSSDVICQP